MFDPLDSLRRFDTRLSRLCVSSSLLQRSLSTVDSEKIFGARE